MTPEIKILPPGFAIGYFSENVLEGWEEETKNSRIMDMINKDINIMQKRLQNRRKFKNRGKKRILDIGLRN